MSDIPQRSKLRRSLTLVVDVAIAIGVAIAIARLIGWRPSGAAEAAIATIDSREVPDWASLLDLAQPESRDADVQVVQFLDFECPSCRITHRLMRRLELRYGSRLAVSTVHFPLKQHRGALAKANAEVCARAQDRSRELQDGMFEAGADVGGPDVFTLAARAGVRDLGAFRACMGTADTLDLVKHGLRAAEALKLQGTPSFVVNGRLLARVRSVEELESHLSRIIEAAP